MLISLCSTAFGQDVTENTLQDQLYQEYKANGIEQSLKMYQKLDTDKTYNGFQEPLNLLGYRLMQEDNDLEAAKKVFEAQIAEYSTEANPYDSYADVLLVMGNKTEAKKNLQKSVSIAEKSDTDLDQQVFRGSIAKIAKLENKHRFFEFLDGTNNIDITNYDGDKVANQNKMKSFASYDEGGNILTINFTNPDNDIMGKRIVVYDAVEDQYDMAFLNSTDPMGIRMSHLKVKDLGNNKLELMESYVDRKGKEHQVRHEIMKNDGSVEWVIFEQAKDSKNWEKATVQNFSKSN
tara:strand:+ start:1025 stop:1900 length:876 start_codon:yes stop_codon:yes gene_type:complete